MATTQATIHYTGFNVGSTQITFGLLWPDSSFLMTDWARDSKYVDIDGISGTTTQTFGFGPRRVSYAAFFETTDDFAALDALVQQTGTLTVVRGGHTVPLDDPLDESVFMPQADMAYDRLANVKLLSLISNGVAPDGTVEAVVTFSRASS